MATWIITNCINLLSMTWIASTIHTATVQVMNNWVKFNIPAYLQDLLMSSSNATHSTLTAAVTVLHCHADVMLSTAFNRCTTGSVPSSHNSSESVHDSKGALLQTVVASSSIVGCTSGQVVLAIVALASQSPKEPHNALQAYRISSLMRRPNDNNQQGPCMLALVAGSACSCIQMTTLFWKELLHICNEHKAHVSHGQVLLRRVITCK